VKGFSVATADSSGNRVRRSQRERMMSLFFCII